MILVGRTKLTFQRLSSKSWGCTGENPALNSVSSHRCTLFFTSATTSIFIALNHQFTPSHPPLPAPSHQCTLSSPAIVLPSTPTHHSPHHHLNGANHHTLQNGSWVVVLWVCICVCVWQCVCLCVWAGVHRFQTTARNDGTLGGATCSVAPLLSKLMHKHTLPVSSRHGECHTRW